jgi:regulatory protein
MTITAIKQQERLKSRYSIYVDGKYAFSLSADALLDQRLHTGQELDGPQLKVYKKLSADDKAYGLALAYVARRMRSRHELTDYFRRLLKSVSKRRLVQELRQKHVADDTIQRAVAEDEADERVVLRELIAKKRRQTKYQDDLRLMQYLARQGFGYDDIKHALAGDELED